MDFQKEKKSKDFREYSVQLYSFTIHYYRKNQKEPSKAQSKQQSSAPLPPIESTFGKSDNKLASLKLGKESTSSLSSSKKSSKFISKKSTETAKNNNEQGRPYSEDNLVQKSNSEDQDLISAQSQPLSKRPLRVQKIQVYKQNQPLPQLQPLQQQNQKNVAQKTRIGYVQKFKEKCFNDLYTGNQDVSKFENPAITQAKKQLKSFKEKGLQGIEEEESIINSEINITKLSDKSSAGINRFQVMKNASSHSSSNSKFQQSSSDKSQHSSKEKSLSFKILKSVIKEKQYDEEIDMDYMSHTIAEEPVFKRDWVQGEFLGAGSFGQVYQAMDRKSGQILALKKINFRTQFDDEDDMKELKSELKLMKKLKHNHIINYFGHEQDDNFIYIFLEYMSQALPLGSLSSIIKRFGPLQQITIRAYSKQILDGLSYLHDNKVVHRDIKSTNVLVDSEGVVKISDFGCSHQMEKTMTIFRSNDKNIIGSLKGSIPWMPPEVITQTKYGYSADIWSFGCTVLEMASGKIPWSEYDFDNPVAAILKIGLEEDIPKIPDDLDSDLKDFIVQCLKRDPEERLTAEQLKKHKFLE